MKYPGSQWDEYVFHSLHPIIIPTGLPVKSLDSILAKPGIIAFDDDLFHARAPFGIPEQRDQVSDIMQTSVDTPLLPVNEVDVLIGGLAWEKKIPRMGIIMDQS